MDARGAARPVAPPRTLDVQQFVSARSRELQALYNAVKAQAVTSGSSLTTPRHLRRRTGSHNRRRQFRWARTRSKKKEAGIEPPAAASSSVGRSNVAGASEEESTRKRKPKKRILSRRVRRRIELQGVRDGTGSCMRDGTRRLATHVWHAKRFPMTKMWGYCLPQSLPGRGRGSQAVFKWVKAAAVLHDASYIGIIELQGTADAIVQTLCTVVEPPLRFPVSGSGVKHEEMHGLLYGNAVLHNVGKSPHEAVSPVTVLWRPSGVEEETPELSTAGEGAVFKRQLWVQVHPSAFDSALQVLSTACQRQGQDNPQAPVKCQSRRGELARLDLLGSRALQVLQMVLRPVSRKHLISKEAAEHSGHQDTTANAAIPRSPEVIQLLRAKIFAKASSLPMAAVLALDVSDPRDTPQSFYSANGASVLETPQDGVINRNVLGEGGMDEDCVTEEGGPIIEEDVSLSYWGNMVEKGVPREVSDNPYLWSPQADQKVVALSQKAFSEKRRKRRKVFFSDVDRDVLHNGLEGGALANMVERSGACPVLLLKHTHLRPSASGWSIIMPITWVQAFWVPLIFAGGHVIGLRERHWLATDAGIPYFPHDFPDCPAYAQHLALETAAFDNANLRRPLSKRAPSFTVSPLQRSVMNAYKGSMSDVNQSIPNDMIVNEHHEHCTNKSFTVAASLSEITNVDGETAMAEDGALVSRAPSVPVSSYSADQAFVPGSIDLDRDTAMTHTGTVVYGSPFSHVACQSGHGVSVHQFPMPCGANATNKVDCPLDAVLSASVSFHRADQEVLSEVTIPNGDIAMMETGAIVAGEPDSQSACQAACAQSLQSCSVTESCCDRGIIQVESLLSGTLSSPVVSDGDDGTVVPEFTNLKWEGAMAETGSVDAEQPLSEGVCTTADGASTLQLTTTAGEKATDKGSSVLEGEPSLSVASQLQLTVSDTHASDQYDAGRCLSGAVVSTVQEISIDEPSNFHNIEVLEVGNSLLKSSDVCQPSVHMPSSSTGHNPSFVLHSNMRSTTVSERQGPNFFVARTIDALMQVLRENGQQHALVLRPGLTNKGGVQNGLRHGRLEWRASSPRQESAVCTDSSETHAVVGGRKKVCYVRVLIAVPHKGVMKEMGVLFSPTNEDFNHFLCRSQPWQGVETSWLNQTAKKPRRNKGKKRRAMAKPLASCEVGTFAESRTDLDEGFKDGSNRDSIGCITSAGPQGSLWSGTGICKAGSLIKLRAMQWADKRWWNRREILLLAGHTSSPLLRPVLVSIALETEQGQDITW